MSTDFENKLESICQSWDQTPWIENQRMKKRGTDCVNFIDCVLEELYRLPPRRLSTFPRLAGLHSRQAVIELALQIIHRYPNKLVDIPSIINEYEVGDVVVTQLSPRSGFGHVFIVGDTSKKSLWHCLYGEGVSCCSIGTLKTLNVLKVWRLLEREKWLLP